MRERGKKRRIDFPSRNRTILQPYEKKRTLTSTAFLVAALRSSPPSAGAARAAKERMEREKKGEDDDELDAIAAVTAVAAADSSSVAKPLPFA